METLSKYQKILLFIGWMFFWLSIFLPINTSLGGLTDVGKSYYGFLSLFYSISSIFVLPTLIMSGLGICNLLIMFVTPAFFFVKKMNRFAKYLMVTCTIYVCIAGTIVSYHFYPILYGHYIWCLSFVIVAVALNLKIDKQNFLS
jgi:hypothetical protein